MRQNEPIMSDAERQNEPDNRMKRDSELMFGSENNKDLPSQQPVYYKYGSPPNQEPIDYKKEETSSTDITDGNKRDDEKKIVPVTDDIKENDLSNGQQNNENGNDFAHNAVLIIWPMPSWTQKKIF